MEADIDKFKTFQEFAYSIYNYYDSNNKFEIISDIKKHCRTIHSKSNCNSYVTFNCKEYKFTKHSSKCIGILKSQIYALKNKHGGNFEKMKKELDSHLLKGKEEINNILQKYANDRINSYKNKKIKAVLMKIMSLILKIYHKIIVQIRILAIKLIKITKKIKRIPKK